jgi:hypothetical protein
MNMRMRFALGVLAYLVPTFALGFVWHLMLFRAYYERLAIYREDVIIPFGFLSMLIQAFVFAWVYQHTFARDNANLLSRGSGMPHLAPYSPGGLRRSRSRPRT